VSRAERRPRDHAHRGASVTRTALLRFVGLSVVTLFVVAIGAVVVGQKIAEGWALDDARLRGATVAQAVAGPLVDKDVTAGDSAAISRLDGILHAAMSEGDISHVKLWTQQGVVIWSDEPAVIGHTYPLDADVEKMFDTRGVTAQVSTLDTAQDAPERGEGDGELLEVYAGVEDGAGDPLVVEAYLPTTQMRAQERTILVALLTLAVGVLVVYQLAVVPLAVSLARRVERGQEQNAQVLRRSLLATHRERLRIAHDLHDGLVQDLAGLTYAMPLVADQLPSTPEASIARQTVADATVMLAHDVDWLRSLLVDIHPPDLEGPGLAVAARDLAERAETSGVAVQLDVPEAPEWSLGTSRLAYRTVQEGLRNVVAHSGASRAAVSVRRRGAVVYVEVSDDGRGIDTTAEPVRGHLGLQLLRENLEDFGGHLAWRNGDTGGTVLAAVLPADIAIG
jgi:signal transduction histidine kinase